MTKKKEDNADKKIVRRGRRVQLICKDPSLAKQAFKESSDINNILKQYESTGVLPLNGKSPIYGDFSNHVQYQDAMNLVINANRQFESLPAKIRERFSNDPVNFLEFVENEDNIEECYRMGLKVRPNPAASAADSEKNAESTQQKEAKVEAKK